MNKRQQQESNEHLETIPNGAPKGRFQNEQQIQNTVDVNADTGDSSFSLNHNKSKGSSLKQEAVAKLVNGGASSGTGDSGMGGSAAGSRGVSGASGGVLGAANSTPIAGQSRSDSRYGKKLDRIATKMNYTPCEQVLEDYDESKPLAEAADADQGFNGTYRNEYARSQKIAGNTPAELMFQRSVDFIYKDQLYFGQGQYVKQVGVATEDVPTISATKVNGIYQYPEKKNYSLDPGDYLHRNCHLTLTPEGQVEEIYFDVENITATGDATTANRASAAAIIDRNVAELNRQSIDAKAGDEKADLWSPLARAIKEPTKTVSLLRDLEAMTGNEVYMAYRKLSTSMAYQLNRTKKDGQKVVDPGVEALLGMLESPNQSGVLRDVYPTILDILRNSNGAVSKSLNSAGCSGLMITAYDSPTKYNTKQDLLLQPRGFRMHLQTADNNMNPLRVDKRFAQAFSALETFSTIDRDYDPLLPICVTDKSAIITKYDWNRLFAKKKRLLTFKFKTSVDDQTQFSRIEVVPPEIARGSISNKRYLHALLKKEVGHGAFTLTNVNELEPSDAVDANANAYFLINESGDTITSYTAGSVEYTEYQDPIQLSDTLLSLGVYALVPTNVTAEMMGWKTEEAWDGGDFVYMYTDLRNKYVVKTNLPLIQGLIKYLENGVGAKMYTLVKDGKICIPMVHSTCFFSLWSLMLCAATPFMITERINSMRDVLYYQDNVEYPFSQLEQIGSIGVKSYLNFSFTDYDHMIDAGIMKPAAAIRWTFPEMFWTVKTTVDETYENITDKYVVMPFYMNQENFRFGASNHVEVDEDKSAMTMPSIRSGVRFAFLDAIYGMTEKDLRLAYDMALPFVPADATEGFAYKYGRNSDGIITYHLHTDSTIYDADITIFEWLKQPREVGYVIDAPYGLLTPKVVSSIDTAGTIKSERASVLESATRGTSHRIRCWSGKGTRFNGSGQAILNPVSVNVNRAANFSQEWYEVVANGKRPDFDEGMVFSYNQLLNGGELITGVSSFTPFINEASGDSISNVGVISFMKAVWTRLQKLPFVISPFEGTDFASASCGISIDPFELTYMFGCCGFRASDYRESVYNREKEVVNQGPLFVSDPWVEASPIFKEGAVATGVSTTKGYEV